MRLGCVPVLRCAGGGRLNSLLFYPRKAKERTFMSLSETVPDGGLRKQAKPVRASVGHGLAGERERVRERERGVANCLYLPLPLPASKHQNKQVVFPFSFAVCVFEGWA